MTAEAWTGGHKSSASSGDTLCGSPVEGHQAPDCQVQSQLPSPLNVESCGAYLVYEIDEGLGIVPEKTPNHLDLITVGEDGVDQEDTLVDGKGAIDQPFPGRRVTTEAQSGKWMRE